MLHQAPNLWTITWKVWKEKSILHYHVRAGLLLSPWTKEKKEVINPPPKWNNNNSKSFLATHINHIPSIQINLCEWMIQPHWSTPPKNHRPTPFPTELPVQQWAGEAHGFWLQTNEEWPHSWCEKHATLRQSLDWNPTPVPPCWTRSKHICN